MRFASIRLENATVIREPTAPGVLSRSANPVNSYSVPAFKTLKRTATWSFPQQGSPALLNIPTDKGGIESLASICLDGANSERRTPAHTHRCRGEHAGDHLAVARHPRGRAPAHRGPGRNVERQKVATAIGALGTREEHAPERHMGRDRCGHSPAAYARSAGMGPAVRARRACTQPPADLSQPDGRPRQRRSPRAHGTQALPSSRLRPVTGHAGTLTLTFGLKEKPHEQKRDDRDF